ncbi:MAG TPA: acyl carrier protein [Humibacillus sp.]|nr:acyl carrier protein [Humibacillus sp.]
MSTTPSQTTPSQTPPGQTTRQMLETALREIVPDASLDGVSGDADLRETFELDSLDFVELVERLGKRAGFRIEDDDADQLRTIDSATAFLARGRSRIG